ncbi:MAG: hypothetical protein EON93_25880, partial [Burkholderiales bacterium]
MLALQVSTAALAQTTIAPAQIAPDSVDISFNPPLDKLLQFRITRTKLENGKAVAPTPLAFIHELRFTGSPTGYTLYWRMPSEGLPKPFRDPNLRAYLMPMVAPFTGEPIQFDIDDEGAPLRVRDWESVKLRIRAALLPFRQIIAAGPSARR